VKIKLVVLKERGLPILGAAVMLAMMGLHALGQTGAPKRPWMEPYTPNLIEWLALETQALEGDTEFGENGMTIHFYVSPEAFRTGAIACDIMYVAGTPAEHVQRIEDGILERFKARRNVYPWARVKIVKKVASLN
jgi:hypothetical protein